MSLPKTTGGLDKPNIEIVTEITTQNSERKDT
jgi:hypothetical protein